MDNQNKPTRPTSQNTPTPRPGAYTDPLVRPTIELPQNSSAKYQSKDIGTKTTVPTNPFVKVEEKFTDKLRNFFKFKSRTKNSASKNSNSTPTAKSNSEFTPTSPSTPVKNPNPATKFSSNSATPTSTNSEFSKNSKNQPPQNPNSKKPRIPVKEKLQHFLHFLFAGWHKFLTVPLMIIVVAETIIIILFLTGIFHSNSISDNNETLSTITDEATAIYDNVSNINSGKDTIDYWNGQIAKVSGFQSNLQAYELRMQAAKFYINRGVLSTAYDFLYNTDVDDTIKQADLYQLYSMILTLAIQLGYNDTAAEYQNKLNQLPTTHSNDINYIFNNDNIEYEIEEFTE